MDFNGIKMNSVSFWVLVVSAAGVILICNVFISLVKKYRHIRRLAAFPSAPSHWLTGHLRHVSHVLSTIYNNVML